MLLPDIPSSGVLPTSSTIVGSDIERRTYPAVSDLDVAPRDVGESVGTRVSPGAAIRHGADETVIGMLERAGAVAPYDRQVCIRAGERVRINASVTPDCRDDWSTGPWIPAGANQALKLVQHDVVVGRIDDPVALASPQVHTYAAVVERRQRESRHLWPPLPIANRGLPVERQCVCGQSSLARYRPRDPVATA